MYLHRSRNIYFTSGNLHRINHLFFRGTINIYAVDNYAFKNSAIKVLVFEGYLQTTKYFLQYGRFRRLELLNCYWHVNYSQQNTASTNTPILADVVKLLNCTVDRLDVTIFSTVTNVVIDNCQIDVVENDDEKFAEGIDSLVFRGTRIGTIANVSLTSATEVRFDRCRIDEISIGSLWLPNVAEIAFRKCSIRELSPGAFQHFQTPYLSFDFCWFEIIDSNLFANITIDDLLFNNTYFGSIKPDAFANVTARRLFLLNSKVNDIQASPFLNAEVGFEYL